MKKARSLHTRAGRDKSQLFLIEGEKLILEAYDKGIHVQAVIASQSYLKQSGLLTGAKDLERLHVVGDKEFRALATTETPQGVLAIAQIPRQDPESLFKRGSPLVVVCAGLQDPGNLGTIIRTAMAAGSSGLILTKGTVDAYNPKVVRSAMGALFSLPLWTDVADDQAIEALVQRGARLFACQMRAGKHFWQIDLSGFSAIVLGNEGQGLPQKWLEAVDELVSIPMHPQSESLNVAVAAGIILFSAVKQRLEKEAIERAI